MTLYAQPLTWVLLMSGWLRSSAMSSCSDSLRLVKVPNAMLSTRWGAHVSASDEIGHSLATRTVGTRRVVAVLLAEGLTQRRVGVLAHATVRVEHCEDCQFATSTVVVTGATHRP